MRPLDLLAIAWGAVSGQRLRAGLSLVGVAVGVAAVVVLTALGEGARRYVSGQFESLGTNLLIVIPGKNETTGAIPGVGGAPNDLTVEDAEVLLRRVPQAELVVPLAVGNETVSHGERRRQVTVIGATDGFLEARRLAVRSGTFLPATDWERASPVAVLGAELATELFEDENPLGGVVRIGEARARVIGVLEPRGTQLGVNMDDLVVVPVASAMQFFDRRSLFRVLIQVGVHTEIELAEERVLDVLAERHGEEDVTCLTQDAVAGALGGILAVLTLAVAGIAGVSLTVAGIGIMNVMLVSVSERTSEVGLLRAVGARRGQILALFLVEAVLLSSAGGLIGLAVSWLATRLVMLWYPTFPAEPPAWAVGASLLLSLIVGALFGVLPARGASRLDPVIALGGK
ncbi:MAG: ABC transporter permease [Planctomycetota bacterium]|nr:ABC transporter permease [Planctomycetota bacterium]MDP6763650.1 ABC transporter permease [Planctomycetota bacterium]MDP6990923.1 ABC transporter permease [Planctomycetota bacterium]